MTAGTTRLTVLVLLALALPTARPAAQSVEFAIEETLSLPTHDSVVLSLVPASDVELFANCGFAGSAHGWETAVQQAAADSTVTIELDGLKAGGHYEYRVWVRPAGSAAPFAGRPAHDFHALRLPGATFSFAYTADAHLYDLWAKATFTPSTSGYAYARKSFDNLAHDAALDFFILAGDHASTHCHQCPGGTVDGITYAPNYALTLDQARLRYRKLLAPEHAGQVTCRIPVLYVLGNHEGETAPTMIGCGHSALNASVSRSARMEALPNPRRAFEGNVEGTYYAFEAGDALVVVLDVMGFSASLPSAAADWSLGDEQLAWLEKVLRVSDRTWTFVVAEHLVGGVQIGLAQCYHYGRGGLRATGNHLPTGNFLGEQAQVQQLLAQHVTPGGAAFFMCGHDHVAMLPVEKPTFSGTGTGVYYVKAGSIGASAGSWKQDPKFQKQMDWDLDGEADYYGDVTGSLRRGYFRITVEGPRRVTFEYVVTDPWNPALDGTVLMARTIDAE